MPAVTLNRTRRRRAIRPLSGARGKRFAHRPIRPLSGAQGKFFPSAPSAPSAPGVGAKPGLAGPAPLADDAQSVADRAALRFRTQQGIASSQQQSTYAQTDFQEALRRMSAQRPKDEQTTKEGANREGLFYSGQLGTRLSDLAARYAERESDTRSQYDRGEAARVAERQGLLQGQSIEEMSINAGLVDRNIGRDSDAAALGALAPPPAPGAPGSVTASGGIVKGRPFTPQHRPRAKAGKGKRQLIVLRAKRRRTRDRWRG